MQLTAVVRQGLTQQSNDGDDKTLSKMAKVCVR